ncbi:uncharacterized protein [Coffea arabica]|uniref:Uncharacterized protein LOC113725532 n=1 Tax=Coffea arabica TaxID=13443 RepID=A0A6P6VRJ0_COFAR|nr:uncharacterized protein LOC113725532 [Coffea arabica]XP_027104552.1 uncharacterized protein LOC113725532 [Coffea arabica]
MEGNQNTPSVIARLMGIDELPPQQPSNRQLKVLSEDYLRKSASIGMLGESSLLSSRLTRKTAEKQYAVKHVFSSEIPENGKRSSQSIPGLKPNQATIPGLHLQRSDIFHQKGDMESGEYVELLQYKSRVLNAKVTETEKMTTEPPTYCFMDPWQVENKSAKEKWKYMSGRQRYASRSRITTEDSSVHAPKALVTSSQGSFGWKHGEQVSCPFHSGSFFASEAKKQIFERWKTTRSFPDIEVSGRRCSLGQMFAIQDKEARPTSLYSKLEENRFSNPSCLEKESSEFGISLVSTKVGSTNKYIRNLRRPKLLKYSPFASESTSFKTRVEASKNSCCSGKKETVTDKHQKLNSEKFYGKDSVESGDSTVIREKQHQYLSADLECSHNPDYELSNSKILSSDSDDNVSLEVNQGVQDDLEKGMHKEAEGYSCSDVSDNLARQKSSCDSPGEEFILRCTAKDSEFAINLREINQPSPDSVLEPLFKEENPPDSEIFKSSISDLSGLALKLHLLNPKSEETNSEGSGMAVSSDEDTEKESVDLSRDNGKLWGMSRPEESRDFSYLVDVLDEDNLFGMDLAIWHGRESPVSPSVFEALEKKYGKQTSWAKSERRLLFDLINSRLRDILDSCMDFCMSRKPLRRRLSSNLSRDDIEEDLWMLLSQDKEVRKDLGDKVLGGEMKWMELEGDISIICREIVEYLIDELAAEFCSSESP